MDHLHANNNQNQNNTLDHALMQLLSYDQITFSDTNPDMISLDVRERVNFSYLKRALQKKMQGVALDIDDENKSITVPKDTFSDTFPSIFNALEQPAVMWPTSATEDKPSQQSKQEELTAILQQSEIERIGSAVQITPEGEELVARIKTLCKDMGIKGATGSNIKVWIPIVNFEKKLPNFEIPEQGQNSGRALGGSNTGN